MARLETISVEEVKKVVEHLESTGQVVNSSSIRRITNKGSFALINRHLKTINQQSIDIPKLENSDSFVQEFLSNLVPLVKSNLLRHHKSISSFYENRFVDLQRKISQLSNTNKELNNEINVLKSIIKDKNKNIDMATKNNYHVLDDKNKLKEENSVLRALLEEERKRVKQLNSDLRASRKLFEKSLKSMKLKNN